MKPCSPGIATEVPGDGSGEGVSVYVSQASGDPGGWWLYIYAETPEGLFFVRRIVVPAPFRDRSRIVARLVEPGANTWRVTVEPPKDPATGDPLASSAIRVGVVACPREFATGPVDVVSKGLTYATGSAPATVTVPPGARMKEISMIAGAGAGSITVTVQRSAGTTETLGAVPVPAGTAHEFDAADLEGSAIASVAFAGVVAGYKVVWVE